MNRTRDIEFGTRSEQKMLTVLQEKLKNPHLKKESDKYALYDYYSKHMRVELKTRRNKSDAYPTTMIGLNKVRDAEIFDGEYYYIFKFDDKTMWIKYNEKKFMNFDVGGGRRSDRGGIEEGVYVYIPIEYLKEL